MIRSYKDHLINQQKTVKEVLSQLDKLASDAILFVVDDEKRLVGSLTDGDVRRGLISDKSTSQPVTDFIQPNPRFVEKGKYDISLIIEYRERNFKIIPVVDQDKKLVNIINFKHQQSYLPVDALVMAGGRGSRLRPKTDNTPKPLLKVGLITTLID
jgi:Mg/Co/Ni transporter MgtE